MEVNLSIADVLALADYVAAGRSAPNSLKQVEELQLELQVAKAQADALSSSRRKRINELDPVKDELLLRQMGKEAIATIDHVVFKLEESTIFATNEEWTKAVNVLFDEGLVGARNARYQSLERAYDESQQALRNVEYALREGGCLPEYGYSSLGGVVKCVIQQLRDREEIIKNAGIMPPPVSYDETGDHDDE